MYSELSHVFDLFYMSGCIPCGDISESSGKVVLHPSFVG